MIQRRKSIALILMVLMVGILCSCAAQTPLQTFATADEEYINTLETYNRHYDLQDEATQKEWDAQYRPAIQAASEALNAWKLALYYNSSDVADKQEVYKAAKDRLILLLSDILVEEK